MRTVVYGGTRNVYSDMVTACKSLLFHRGADRVFFLIENDTFPEPLPDCVQCINVSRQTFFKPDNPNARKRWTYMSMMRCVLPFLPQLSGRVLWLDIDTIVCGDLGGLWALPDAPLHMAREVGRAYEYYNAGVLLMDCELFRDDARQVVLALNNKTFDFPDQDSINQIMRGRILTLPPEFNVSDWTVKGSAESRILHFAAVRDWRADERWQRFERMAWEEIMAPL